MFVLTINGIEYQYHTHVKLVKSLGGLQAIKAKLETPLLFGEKYYLQNVVKVADKFTEMLDEQFGRNTK
ncbi:hypothetical protein BRC2024_KWYBBTRE_CDS_0090 [Acinetobacter phage vB_AbaM_AB-Navy-v2]